MKDQYVYVIGNKLYVNLTNRCSNACDFCVRNYDSDHAAKHGYEGYDLWLDKEPSANDVEEMATRVLAGRKDIEEVVFCGFGEPTYRLDVMCEVADFAHARGLRTRVNTNGQGSEINGRDISADIASHIDTVNVSLNATDAEKYDGICHSIYGKRGFDVMLDFAKKCVMRGADVVLSVVDIIGEEEIEKAQAIADSIGARLRVRAMIHESDC